ncbi:hypothetical protein [Gilvimarinus japonicus]|jgi:hypothetical protein|uniref:Uncharacterized protein n=1 Tax=Gilvimarinus japonicus TaxID=1796469 RepID=A0ABV7HN06_9GAMM
MARLLLVVSLIIVSACSHNKTDNYYWCSYETTEEAYQTCMDVANGVDDDTANAAGKRVNH